MSLSAEDLSIYATGFNQVVIMHAKERKDVNKAYHILCIFLRISDKLNRYSTTRRISRVFRTVTIIAFFMRPTILLKLSKDYRRKPPIFLKSFLALCSLINTQ